MTKTNDSLLDLNHFFPYQLSKLQARISDNIAQIYTGKFDLSKQEWRILAILSNQSPLTATQVATLTELDKMPASRAIAKMLSRQLIDKVQHKTDKRSTLLNLSTQGQQLIDQLAPMAKEKEQQLLSVLTHNEQDQLRTILAKLTNHSTKILNISH